jgi:uncharacterized FAD-dependent dehydrogenase
LTPSYRPGVQACALDTVLPPYVAATLRLGLTDFDRKIKNFAGPWGLLTGVETRTSAPLRILRGSGYESLTHRGLYPCGEGAGYAGGIMSAALDGYHVARALMARYKPFLKESVRHKKKTLSSRYNFPPLAKLVRSEVS